MPKFDLYENDFLDGTFDVIGVTETWLTPCIPNGVVTAKGYKLLRKDINVIITNNNTCRSKKGGGLCLYLKDNLEFEEIKPLQNQEEFEWLCIKLIRGNAKQQTLTLVYRPPSSCVTKAVENLRHCMDYLNENYRNSEHTLIGDVNINYDNSRCQYTKSLKSLEQFYNLRQLIKLPTRLGFRNSSIIDLCFTSMNNVSSAGVIEYRLSDHYPIFVIKKKCRPSKKEKNFTGRCYKNFKVETLRNELTKLDWTVIKYERDPNIQWNLMQEYLTKVADLICPLKTFKVTKYRPKYLTDEIIEIIKERDIVYRLARQHNDDSYWQRGAELAKTVTNLVKNSKKEFILDQLEKNRTDSKKFWNTVKILLPDEKDSNLEQIWDPNQNKMVSGLEASNLANTYFSTIGKKLALQIECSDTEYEPHQTDCMFIWGNLNSRNYCTRSS